MGSKVPKEENLAEFLYLAEDLKHLSERYLARSKELLTIAHEDFCPEMLDSVYEEVFNEQQKLYPIKAMLDIPPIKYDKDNKLFRAVLDASIQNFTACLENITNACVAYEQRKKF